VAVTKIDNGIPGLAPGKADELFEKVKSIREFAETFDKKSRTVIEEARRSLLDISQAAIGVTHKLDPQGGESENPRPPRKPNPRRQ